MLLHLGRTYESWAFSFRLADADGLPLPTGVSYLTEKGPVLAGVRP